MPKTGGKEVSELVEMGIGEGEKKSYAQNRKKRNWCIGGNGHRRGRKEAGELAEMGIGEGKIE